jgi:hypothetical protein
MPDNLPSWQPNLSWITEQLAVGGSFPSAQAGCLARDHGVGAVVDLREEDRDDEGLLQTHGIAWLHLPTPDMCGVEPARLDQGVAFVCGQLERGRRVLVHCEHGIGRSATLALCVMVSCGEAPLDALERMKQRRAVVSPSPAQFACWSAWLARHAARHRPDWEAPDLQAFQAIAYRDLRGAR